MDYKNFLACGAILLANGTQVSAQTDNVKDKTNSIKTELKFDASNLNIDDFELKTDEVAQEVLQAKKVTMAPKGVLANPYAATYNMDTNGTMEFYGSDSGLLAVRYKAPNGTICAVNADMNKDLIAKLDAASHINDDIELTKLAKDIAKAQEKSGMNAEQIVRSSFEGYAFDESQQKGLSFQDRVNLNFGKSIESSGTYTAWAQAVNKTTRSY